MTGIERNNRDIRFNGMCHCVATVFNQPDPVGTFVAAYRLNSCLEGRPIWFGTCEIWKEHGPSLISHFFHAHGNTGHKSCDFHITEDCLKPELHQWCHSSGEGACRCDDFITRLQVTDLEREYISRRATVDEDATLLPKVFGDLLLESDGPWSWCKPSIL